MANHLLEAAKAALHRGWYVFGTLPKSKKPYKNTHGHLDALNNDLALRRWDTNPDANPCVRLDKSGLVVLDVDHGLTSFEHAEAWAAANGIPETYIVRSGRKTGGFHFYFKGTRTLPDVTRNAHAGRVGFELDGASGDIKHHGYVVLEGGIHKSGSTYVGNGKSIAFLPDFICDYRDPKDVKRSEALKTKVAKWAEKYPDADPTALLKKGDNRHSILLSDAGRLRQIGLEEDAIYLGLKQIAARFFEDGENYNDDELRRLAHDVGVKPCDRVLLRRRKGLVIPVAQTPLQTARQSINQFLIREFPVSSLPMSMCDIVARIDTAFPDISARTARRAIKEANFVKVGLNPTDERVPLWARRGERTPSPPNSL